MVAEAKQNRQRGYRMSNIFVRLDTPKIYKIISCQYLRILANIFGFTIDIHLSCFTMLFHLFLFFHLYVQVAQTGKLHPQVIEDFFVSLARCNEITYEQYNKNTFGKLTVPAYLDSFKFENLKEYIEKHFWCLNVYICFELRPCTKRLLDTKCFHVSGTRIQLLTYNKDPTTRKYQGNGPQSKSKATATLPAVVEKKNDHQTKYKIVSKW